jgi:hypothetical protein
MNTDTLRLTTLRKGLSLFGGQLYFNFCVYTGWHLKTFSGVLREKKRGAAPGRQLHNT